MARRKTGVFYRHEQGATTASGRGVLAEKVVIGWQCDSGEFGRRLHWAAMRGGLGRARHVLVAGDGAPWIWNMAQDRWAGATQVLDFYHASQHPWELGRALHGEDDAAVARWVEPRGTNSGTGNKNKCWRNWRRCRRPPERRARWCGARRSIWPATPNA